MPHPHYVLGQPYQSGGIWWYPRESQDLDQTGLATIYPPGHAPLTTDGEAFSQDALAISHPTLQLPAIARLTNLENGRSLLVRVNDRGAPTPHRLTQVTRRVANLLGMPRDGVAQVRLTVLAPQSAAAEDQAGGAPRLAISAAPRGAVQASDLAPPSGKRRAPAVPVTAAAGTAPTPVPQDTGVDGSVSQLHPQPGRLWVRLDRFQSYEYAAIQRAKLIGSSPRIVSVFEGRAEGFQVELGPYTRVGDADAALDQAIAAGISDARIVIE